MHDLTRRPDHHRRQSCLIDARTSLRVVRKPLQFPAPPPCFLNQPAVFRSAAGSAAVRLPQPGASSSRIARSVSPFARCMYPSVVCKSSCPARRASRGDCKMCDGGCAAPRSHEGCDVTRDCDAIDCGTTLARPATLRTGHASSTAWAHGEAADLGVASAVSRRWGEGGARRGLPRGTVAHKARCAPRGAVRLRTSRRARARDDVRQRAFDARATTCDARELGARAGRPDRPPGVSTSRAGVLAEAGAGSALCLLLEVEPRSARGRVCRTWRPLRDVRAHVVPVRAVRREPSGRGGPYVRARHAPTCAPVPRVPGTPPRLWSLSRRRANKLFRWRLRNTAAAGGSSPCFSSPSKRETPGVPASLRRSRAQALESQRPADVTLGNSRAGPT